MANDRIFIKCESCGAWKTLMKHYPGALATRDNGILEWLDAHAVCHPDYYDMFLKSGPGFSFHTEDDFNILDENKNSAMPPNNL